MNFLDFEMNFLPRVRLNLLYPRKQILKLDHENIGPWKYRDTDPSYSS